MPAPYGNHNHLKHGMGHSRIYFIWKSMKQRCHNKNSSNYERYGGRGIKVCDEWRNDFQNFYNWSIQNGYSDDLTIDRINNDGNYDPSNCRWATAKEQSNNKRNNKHYECNGETHTLGEWGSILGISSATIWARLKRGWSVEKTLTQKLL